MKHAGQARRAALKLVFWAWLGAVLLGCCTMVAHFLPAKVFGAAAFLWVLFVVFTLYFFRDPTAQTPAAHGLVVSPGHGKVDVVDDLDDAPFIGGPCHRISIFLSILDVHVQNAPVSGTVNRLVHTPGKYVSALRADSALYNENVLIVFDSSEVIGEKIGLRLIAGVLARRIVPFVKEGDEVARGERVSLIQFGSRCDLYLPLRYEIRIKPGDKVAGGETIVAAR
jgi:phosphatidylserine decarboxylase